MDDWQVGDLALCLIPEGQVSCGGIYTVADVFFGDDDIGQGWALELVEFPNCIIDGEYFDGFDAWRFRKIKPLSDEERDSFLADLKEPA